MRSLKTIAGLALALSFLLSACGTKGPLTLPPKLQEVPQATQSAAPAAAPASDPNTGAEKR